MLLRLGPIPINVQLEEERVPLRRARDDLLHRKTGIVRDALRDALRRTPGRHRLLAVRVHELRHRGRRHEQWHADVTTQDPRLGAHVPHVAQDTRPEPNPVEGGLVCVAGDEVCRGAAVECPCFLGEGAGSDFFEVVAVDEAVEGRLLVELELRRLFWRRSGPVRVYCALVDGSYAL